MTHASRLLSSTACTVLLMVGAHTSANAQTSLQSSKSGAGVSGSTEEIVITAGRTPQAANKIARSVVVIGEDLILENLNKTSNIGDLLGTAIPGFGPPNGLDITRAQTLRGREPQYLIDGVPLGFNSGSGIGGSPLTKFDPEILGRVEVLYGPNAVYGAGATGGVIQFFTRSASEEPFQLRIRQQLSTFLDAGEIFGSEALSYKTTVSASGTVGKFDYLGTFSYDSVNGVFDGEGDLANPVFYGFRNELSYFAKLGFNITDDQRLEGFYNYIDDDPDGRIFQTVLQADGRATGQVDPNQTPFNFGPNNEPKNIKKFWNVRYNHDALFGGAFSLQYYGRDEERIGRFVDLRANAQSPTWPTGWPDNYQAFFTDEGFGLRTQYARTFADRFKILIGADYEEQERASDAVVFNLGDDFDETRDVSEFGREAFFLFPWTLDTLGLFIQVEVEVSPKLRVSGGLRWEDLEYSIGAGTRIFERTLVDGQQVSRPGGSGDNSGIAFNIGVSYDAFDWLTVFANFSQGFELPSLSQVAGQVPPQAELISPDAIDPQIVNNFEIGLKGVYGDFDYSLAVFYADSELGQNFIYNPETLAGEFNRAPQENYGLEVVLGYQPTDDLRFSGAFSWNDGDFDNNGDDPGGVVPLSGLDVQPWKLTLNVDYDVSETLELNAQLLKIGTRTRALDEGVDFYPFTGYTTIDVGAFWEIGPGELGVQVTNLLNNSYIGIGSQTYIGNPAFAPRVAGAPGRGINLAYNITF